ncbi:centrosomal protein of 68 kDa isoform X1 [Sarcophilus harrisii]|uniref:Centrosomal protein of 68 kDa n=1 Tax=Sarcophilus harrisii TaxID=9305 RepID=A0A7N4PXQ4_SARHA|nr:centrosomal protein of 68 kDa isoform X1 [Sarcophilus harrisii]XP_031806440.1 centrosomal protein of 68 kDa isoform X1 [Sarcophilus harrisii]XP_031806441.1 centrosomal protein of 68 kDa isoform X1 [Sarcophilus harrisii]
MGPDLGRRSLSSMALSEEKTLAESETEGETVLDGNVKPHGNWNSQELETDCSMALGSMQHFIDARGGKCFPPGEEEELTNRKAVPDHIVAAGAWKKHHSETSEGDPFITESEPVYSHLLPEDRTATGTENLLSKVGAQIEEKLCLDSPELLQSITDPLARTLSSGEVADDEDDHSSLESPRIHDSRQQPYNSSSSFSLKWKSFLNLDVSALSFSSHRFPTSPPQNGCLQQRNKTGSHSLWPATSSSCVPSDLLSSASGPMPPTPRSGGAVAEASTRRSSFQADYWACVLPDSLPPSPDRRSRLWNPNKEYEDLLDYTYPLKPKAQLPKHADSHVLANPFLHDSGVDVDSFSLSPENTLKSPATLSHDCLPTEPDVQLPSEPRNSEDRFSTMVSQTQGGLRLAASGHLTSTPKASNRQAFQNDKEQPLMNLRKPLPVGRCLEAHLPSPGEWSRSSSFSTLIGKNGASGDLQSLSYDASMESGWKTSEDIEIEEEYLALPPRLTQFSSLAPYLSTIQTNNSQPSVSTKGQDLPAASSQEPTPLLHPSTQKSPAWKKSRGKWGTTHRDCCTQIPHYEFQELDREGDNNILISQDPRGPLSQPRTISSLRKMLAGLAYSDLKQGQHLKKERDQERESLLQCVKTFCCHLEELICWLYKVAEVTDNLIPSKSNISSLKSSLQLYRQFKKDIAEHQSLTESVLQKGEILLQCLLDNTPVLKDVLGLIARQSSELEDHAERLYDSVLAALDVLAGSTSGPDSKPATCERI